MRAEVKHHADGSISTIVRKIEKKIRAADGTFRTMVSYDGESWRLSDHAPEEQLRLKRAVNLRGTRWAQKKKKNFDARINPGRSGPAIPPVLVFHGEQLIGKEIGKKQKYRRNLRRKKEKLVRKAYPSHQHVCRGRHHPIKWNSIKKEKDTSFICACSEPRKSRYCGPGFCLYD